MHKYDMVITLYCWDYPNYFHPKYTYFLCVNGIDYAETYLPPKTTKTNIELIQLSPVVDFRTSDINVRNDFSIKKKNHAGDLVEEWLMGQPKSLETIFHHSNNEFKINIEFSQFKTFIGSI